MDYSKFEEVLVRREGDVFVITLNRPEHLNAMSPRMFEELPEVLHMVDYDPDCRVAILTGAGRGFCAGGDVTRWGDRALAKRVRVRGREGQQRIIDPLLDMETPIIAMVNGPAVGQGAIIALYCDIVVASTQARIGDRHINFGLVAGDGGAVILPLLIGLNRAKEMLFTGKLVGGREAAEIGLVNHCVEPEELYDFTMNLAREIAEMSPYAIKCTKVTINHVLKQSNLHILDMGEAFEWLSMHDEGHHEAVAKYQARKRGG